MADKIQSYKDLIVWQKAMLLVDEVYTVTKALPRGEYYILIPQMLRAAVSIPSNIAEGFRRKSRAEYMHYLTIAIGSAAELETQLEISKRQYNAVSFEPALVLTDEVQRMLNTMTASYRP